MRSLETCQNAFNLLLANANPLITPSSGTDISANDETFLIQGSLSLATMPEALVIEINDPILTEKWRLAHQDLIDRLRDGIINECIPLANDENLFTGKVQMEPVEGTEPRCYTPEQYALHAQNILAMVRKSKNKGAVCAAPLFVPIPGIFLFIKSSEIIIPCQEKIFRIPAKQIPDIISIIFFIKICSSLREIGDPAAAVPVGIRCDKAYKFLF